MTHLLTTFLVDVIRLSRMTNTDKDLEILLLRQQLMQLVENVP